MWPKSHEEDTKAVLRPDTPKLNTGMATSLAPRTLPGPQASRDQEGSFPKYIQRTQHVLTATRPEIFHLIFS